MPNFNTLLTLEELSTALGLPFKIILISSKLRDNPIKKLVILEKDITDIKLGKSGLILEFGDDNTVVILFDHKTTIEQENYISNNRIVISTDDYHIYIEK
jgi:hypothetical protein